MSAYSLNEFNDKSKHDILLKNSEGKTANLNTESIAQWLKSILNKRQLGVIGIQNAKDVDEFLKSPVGKSLLAEINLELILEASIQKQNKADLAERKGLMHLLMAFLFQSLLIRKHMQHST